MRIGRWAVVGLVVVLTSGCGDTSVAPVASPTADRSESRDEPPVRDSPARRRRASQAIANAWLASVANGSALHELDAEIAEHGEQAAAALIEIASNRDDPRNEEASLLLARIGPAAIPAICDGLETADTSTVQERLYLIWLFGRGWEQTPHAERVWTLLSGFAEAWRPGDKVTDDRMRIAFEFVEYADPSDLSPVLPSFVGAFERAHAADRAPAWPRALHRTAARAAPLAVPMARILRDVASVDVYDYTFVLGSIGAASPAVFPILRECLRSGCEEIREAALDILRAWGPEAAAAHDELLPFLEHENGKIVMRACELLSQWPEGRPAALREIPRIVFRETFLIEDRHHPGRVPLTHCAMRTIRLSPTEWHAIAPRVHDEESAWSFLRYARLFGGPVPDLALALERSAVPGARCAAAHYGPLEIATRRLDDADIEVRAYAASIVRANPDGEHARAERVAVACLDSDAEEARLWAIRALSYDAARHASRIVPYLIDPSYAVRRRALSALWDQPLQQAWRPTLFRLITEHENHDAAIYLERWTTRDSLPRVPAPVLRVVALSVLGPAGEDRAVYYPDCPIELLTRLDGGPALLHARVRSWLDDARRSGFESDWQVDHIARLARRAPEAFAPLENELQSFASDAKGKLPRTALESLSAALAGMRNDLDHVAAQPCHSLDHDLVRKLSSHQERGRRALLLHAETVAQREIPYLLERVDPELDGVIESVLQEREGEPSGRLRRRGAVRLARRLPTARGVELIAAIDGEDDVVCTELARIETAAPGSVPLDVVRARLEAALHSGSLEHAPYSLAHALGRRLAPLRTHLESTAKDAHAHPTLRAYAAALLVSSTGRHDVALPVVEQLVAEAERDREWLGVELGSPPDEPWLTAARAVARVLRKAPDGEGVLARYVRACGAWQLRPFQAQLREMGPEAAFAVGALRRALVRFDLGRDEGPVDCVHTLAAIGPAARAALPEIRMYIEGTGDPDGYGTRALEAIGAAR